MVPRQEYPQPQFVRKEWLNLNGEWEFEFDDKNEGLSGKWEEKKRFASKIIVPYPFQSRLSGIADTGFHDYVWYARNFSVPEKWKGKEILLHFGAVDYECRIWLNNKEVGLHRGGTVPFYFNITKFLVPGENRLVLRVEDTQDPQQPRGKQVTGLKPEGCDYDRTTGIWQTVWLEPVPESRIEYFRFTPDIDSRKVHIEGVVEGWKPGQAVSIEIYSSLEAIEQKIVAGKTVNLERGVFYVEIPIKNPELWSPESPHLYGVKFTLLEGKKKIDEVISYFGMRKISIKGNKILLNNKPYYLRLVLDQGYFPESLLALPSDRAVKKDIEFTKAFGFNGCRKHQKVDDPRFYYWADRLGLIVWAEFANARVWSEKAEEMFLSEWPEVIKRDYNHPCIICWVPFNESWGVPELGSNSRQQEFVKRVVRLTREMDSTRLVVDNDGWEHVDTDLVTIHDYSLHAQDYEKNYAQFKKDRKTLPAVHKPVYAEGLKYDGKPILITEYGGIAYKLPGGNYPESIWGYHTTEIEEEKFISRFKEVTEAILRLDFCCGFCYTQLTDIQQEINGMLTFDRVPKVSPAKIAKILKGKSPGYQNL